MDYQAEHLRSIDYIRAKVNQLLMLLGTLPLRPEELDNATLIELDPIGIVADSFQQVLANLDSTNHELNLARSEIRAIFDSMGAAIMVLNNDGLLEDCNRQALEQFFILGDPGIGKSRLLLELDDWLELQNDYFYFTARADPLSRKAPRGLLRDLLSNRFGIQDSDSPAELLVKISEGLAEVILPEAGDGLTGRSEILMKARFIGWMAGFEVEDPEHLRESDPRQVARRGVVYLVEYLRAMGRRTPLVVVLEDLHWADDSSLDLLHDLDLAASGIPILVVCASRMLLLERRPECS